MGFSGSWLEEMEDVTGGLRLAFRWVVFRELTLLPSRPLADETSLSANMSPSGHIVLPVRAPDESRLRSFCN